MMRSMFFFIFLPILVACAPSLFDSNFDDLWKTYKIKHGKTYPQFEDDGRRLIWESNIRLITKHNLEVELGQEEHTYHLGLNKFSDMTSHELNMFRKCFANHSSSLDIQKEIFKSPCGKACRFTLPSSVDWRTKGLVTPVKDQGMCGSCWAFSATGALEGQTKVKTGELVSLSEQNLVDCSGKQGNEGCNGGWMDYAFQYVIDNKGIDTEKAYPYVGEDRYCKFKRGGVGANCTSYKRISQGSEEDLQAAVANVGPVSVAIDASSDKFMHYKDGIFYDRYCSNEPESLDHAVLVVGYGSLNGKDYWIVKNSWGPSWGMKGYILMARNARNSCGIATHAVYPVI